MINVSYQLLKLIKDQNLPKNTKYFHMKNQPTLNRLIYLILRNKKSRHTFIGRLPLSGFVVGLVKVREAGSHLEDSCQWCDVKLTYTQK